MASFIVDAVVAVLFFGGVIGAGLLHRHRHPEAPVKHYYDENSWGPF